MEESAKWQESTARSDGRGWKRTASRFVAKERDRVLIKAGCDIGTLLRVGTATCSWYLDDNSNSRVLLYEILLSLPEQKIRYLVREERKRERDQFAGNPEIQSTEIEKNDLMCYWDLRSLRSIRSADYACFTSPERMLTNARVLVTVALATCIVCARNVDNRDSYKGVNNKKYGGSMLVEIAKELVQRSSSQVIKIYTPTRTRMYR